MFKEANTIENIQARNDALSAVVAMDTAERLYIYISSQTTETPKQLKQSGGFDGQTVTEKCN